MLDVDNEQIIEKSLLEAIKQKNTLIFNELFNKNKQLKKDQLKKTYLFKRAITVFNRTTQNAKEAQNSAND